MNLSSLLESQSSLYSDKTFLLFEHQATRQCGEVYRSRLTYAELNQQVNQTCHFLDSLGVGKGNVINLHLPNCPSFITLWFAAARIGAIIMPTNILSSQQELLYLLQHSDSVVSFTTLAYQADLEQCRLSATKLQSIVTCDPFCKEPSDSSFESKRSRQPTTTWRTEISDSGHARNYVYLGNHF